MESDQINENSKKVEELEAVVQRLTNQRAKDKSDIDTLKTQKKEQSLKMVKSSKENMMKQKGVESNLKKSESQVAQLEQEL